jgi:hypothetical protein
VIVVDHLLRKLVRRTRDRLIEVTKGLRGKNNMLRGTREIPAAPGETIIYCNGEKGFVGIWRGSGSGRGFFLDK